MGLMDWLSGKRAGDDRAVTLAAHGFAPCPESADELERRFNLLSSTTGQGGYGVRDPYRADVWGTHVYTFIGVPPTARAPLSGARPVPVFLLPFPAVKGRAQVWLTNSVASTQPLLTSRMKLAVSVLDDDTPGSALTTLEVPAAWQERSVIAAIGEPGSSIDTLLAGAARDLHGAGEHGFFRAVFGDGWLVLENFPLGRAFSAPHGALEEQCTFVTQLASRRTAD